MTCPSSFWTAHDALIWPTFVCYASVPLHLQFSLLQTHPLSFIWQIVTHPLTQGICNFPSEAVLGPSGCLSHFLFCAPLALCTSLTALRDKSQNCDLFTDSHSLKTESCLKARTIPCFFASPPYPTAYPQALWELRPCLNHIYVSTLPYYTWSRVCHISITHECTTNWIKSEKNRPSTNSGLK